MVQEHRQRYAENLRAAEKIWKESKNGLTNRRQFGDLILKELLKIDTRTFSIDQWLGILNDISLKVLA